ncbi:MAG TPA: phosphotransferase [Actinophytocola sp.]|uniref:phosphotransferase enzyme family protein n=1 Tax=Actinophytocola sp. TaxID=1872138 RepID=UPI002DDCDE49|nr:phosphotransferase [Actinophytocola sp.]HEV2781950.1 phosphotransferase [Actinophytocola sp.]
MDVGDAVPAAVAVAGRYGVRCTDPVVLHVGSNVLVHLRPAPVVARVANLVAELRPGVATWFARDLALSSYLADRGVPVVRPSADPPAGPHEHGGLVLSFWTHVPHDPHRRPTPAEVGRALGGLHAALRGYTGPLPEEGPIGDLRQVLDLLERDGVLAGARLAKLRAEGARLAGEVLALPKQALHGDAHPGNLLATPDGLLWNDFEDTWRGPPAWDLACLANTKLMDGRAALAHYPDPPPDREIEVCLELRRLFGVGWRLLTTSAARRTGAGRGRGR